VEILCGVLTGTVTALNANQEPRGHFFGAINQQRFAHWRNSNPTWTG